MSDTENKFCNCLPQVEDITSSCVCSPCVQKSIETIIATILKTVAECKCEGSEKPVDPTDPTDPIDPTDPGDGNTGVGEEYLLPIDMTSSGNDSGFKVIASSSHALFPAWKAFKKTAVGIEYADCWVSNATPTISKPEHIGLTMGGRKYVVTKVEIVTRNNSDLDRDIVMAPKEMNLEYLDENGDWHEQTEHQVNTVNAQNSTITITVPEERQKQVSGIRLQAYSQFPSSLPTKDLQSAVVARMRIWVKDVV